MASEWLLHHIKLMEGFHPTAYPDPGFGWAIPSIGYGRTEGVYRGETTTRQHEERWLVDKLGYLEDAIAELVTVPLSVNQIEAVVALSYNVGLGGPGVKNPDGSTRGFYESKMRQKINAGDFAGAAEEFSDWIFSNGRRLEGLVTRRAIERARFELRERVV
jgi:lysozyme